MTRSLTTWTAALALALVAAGCGGNDEETLPEPVTTAAEQSAEPVGDPDDRHAVTFGMAEQNGSGQYGSATLVEITEDATEVVVELFSGPDNPQPLHIHQGTCESLGDIAYPLEELEHGRSATRLDVGLNELLDGTYAVNAHRSAAEADEYTACGNVVAELESGTARDEPTDEAYAIGRDLCADVPLDRIAETFGGDRDDLRSLAESLADSLRPDLREGAVEGCLDSLEREEP